MRLNHYFGALANDFGPQSNVVVPSEYEKKKQTFITRSIWTFVMIGGFFASMFMGHIYIIAIVTAVQIISFKEVIAICKRSQQSSSIAFHQGVELVLAGDDDVLLIWRECDLLLQAHCVG